MNLSFVIGVALGLSALLSGDFSGLEEARYSRAKTELRSMADSVTIFKMKFGRLPEEMAELSKLGDLDLPPENDPWGRPYEYLVDGNRFQIISHGASDKTEDDDIFYDHGQVTDMRNQ